MSDMNNISKLPYVRWLEETLQEMVTLPLDAICITAKLQDGAIYRSYHNCNVNDKVLFAGHIQMDAVSDTMRANFKMKAIDDEENDETNE